MRKIILNFSRIILIVLSATLLISHAGSYALAGKVEPVCPSTVKEGDTIIVPVKVVGEKGEVILAWGFDIKLEGLEYLDFIKSGCLAEGSGSFMCNQLSSGDVRCGSYTGDLTIAGEHTLFKIKLKKTPKAKNTGIQLFNFVDHLANAQPSECKVK